MKDSGTLDALPPESPPILEVERIDDKPASHRSRGGSGRASFASRLRALIGWIWRIAIGTLFCLNYFSSILVVGWTYRWMQSRVLRGWWRQSPRSRSESYEEFARQAGAPLVRPRWFWQERQALALSRPTADGSRPGTFRKFLRICRMPWDSLWQNFKVGIQALLGTYLLTGWGCLVMLFSWEFGWLNSFNKGYEQALVGPLTGFIGIFLFIAAMMYVPMAQVHQAVTGDLRAFFDFRFVWRLIQARPLAYAGAAAIMALLAVPLEALKTAPAFFDGTNDAWTNASDAEVLRMLQRYLAYCALVLFCSLLLSRMFVARVYRTAMLRALARGWIGPSDLHPRLRNWLGELSYLDRLPTMVPVVAGAGSPSWWTVGAVDVLVFAFAVVLTGVAGPGAGLAVLAIWLGVWALLGIAFLFRRGGVPAYLGFNKRRLAFGMLFWIWFLFVAKVYVGEFFNYHPIVGFANHPLIQLPCCDYIPNHLR